MERGIPTSIDIYLASPAVKSATVSARDRYLQASAQPTVQRLSRFMEFCKIVKRHVGADMGVFSWQGFELPTPWSRTHKPFGFLLIAYSHFQLGSPVWEPLR
jgi:hypothetical protein